MNRISDATSDGLSSRPLRASVPNKTSSETEEREVGMFRGFVRIKLSAERSLWLIPVPYRSFLALARDDFRLDDVAG